MQEFFDQLKEVIGIFVYQNKDAIVQNFKLTSDDSNIQINARLDKVDFFNNFSLEKLKQTNAQVKIDLDPFVFDDLSSFLPVTNLLDQKVEIHLKANGPYGNLDLENLSLNTGKTFLQVKGRVQNLHEPSRLYMDVNIFDSYASYKDVVKLLPGVSLPNFEEIALSDLNVAFKGEPTNFYVDLKSKVNNGSIDAVGKLDVKTSPMQYDMQIKTSKLNLAPVVGESSSLNVNAKIVGSGSSPEELQSNINLEINNSSFAGYNFDKVKLQSQSAKKIVRLSLDGFFNKSEVSTAGFFNFVEDGKPKYDLEGKMQNLNLAEIFKDDAFTSNLNFSFDANGHYFDLDSLYGMCNLRIDSSSYSSKFIDKARLSLQVVKSDINRNIYLDSDFADFTITGDFSLENAIDVLSYEAMVISNIASEKSKQLSPLYKTDSTVVAEEIPEEIISKELNFDFSFNFKDFELIAIMLGEEKLDIAGSGSGSVSNTKDNFSISTDLYIDYLLTVGEEVFYISDLETDLKLSRNNNSLNFEDLFGSISLNCDRIYSGMDIENIKVDLIFNQSKMFFNLASQIDKKLGLETDGNLTITAREQEVTLNDLQLEYNQTTWKNLRPIVLNLKPGESLDIEDFAIYNNAAAVFVNGLIYNDGRQNIRTSIQDVDGELLSKVLTGNTKKLFDAKLSFNGLFTGTFTEPLMELELNIDSVSYGGIHFGKLIGTANYSEKNITLNTFFRIICCSN